ncbi:hypothetical protein Ciccas_000927 [Cichlidogyrus casuarinus]|uniref:Uncharacterized protein n=1 Tax=Cichlidogyrus casuarinus TaxID=1844966 RepID=A0ABD2QLT4_9PLAT
MLKTRVTRSSLKPNACSLWDVWVDINRALRQRNTTNFQAFANFVSAQCPYSPARGEDVKRLYPDVIKISNLLPAINTLAQAVLSPLLLAPRQLLSSLFRFANWMHTLSHTLELGVVFELLGEP